MSDLRSTKTRKPVRLPASMTVVQEFDLLRTERDRLNRRRAKISRRLNELGPIIRRAFASAGIPDVDVGPLELACALPEGRLALIASDANSAQFKGDFDRG